MAGLDQVELVSKPERVYEKHGPVHSLEMGPNIDVEVEQGYLGVAGTLLDGVDISDGQARLTSVPP